MKTLLRLAYFLIVYGTIILVTHAADDTGAAPYFQIVGPDRDGSGPECLPLKSSEAKVKIDGTIARVHLTQRYGNAGNAPIEALYVFPCSTRAAVHGMTLSTGGRVVSAKIKEKVKAKEEYQAAKAGKKTAALLEEHRPNVFQMSVANLLPGDDIEIEIEWTETIPALDSTYEYVFPTVVGPRYSGSGAKGEGTAWAANPHLHPGAGNPASFTISADLTTTLPLTEVTCGSHPIVIDFKAKNQASIQIDMKPGDDAANRDFILRWKLDNEQVDAGLLLHRQGGEQHFLLQVAPPARVSVDQIPPRDFVMLVDVSGSMNGFPLQTAKGLLAKLVRGLRPDDTFNVVSFASGSDTLSETPLRATPENVKLAAEFIDGRHSGGGTELNAALKKVLALPGGENRSRSILIVTDGYITADVDTKDLIRKSAGDANVFTFGIGSSVNRELIESVARVGGGEPVIVTTSKEADMAADRFREMIARPVLSKVRITGEGVTLEETEPDPHGDVFAARPLVITGKWSGEPSGKIVVRGIAGNGRPFEKAIDLAEAAAANGVDHPALPVLWARERVRHFTDGEQSAESIREITELGLRYSLLTPYTSFLAVDEVPRETDQVAMTVKQPVASPKGVSTASVSGGPAQLVQNGSVPEPGAIGLISLLVVLLALQRQRDN